MEYILIACITKSEMSILLYIGLDITADVKFVGYLHECTVLILQQRWILQNSHISMLNTELLMVL